MSLTASELARLRSTGEAFVERVVDLTQRICAVPAPTGEEQQRAEFVASLWRERGYTPEVDEVGNVYVQRGKQSSGLVLMLLAHLDTVFPYETPLKIERSGDILRGPGIGDNSLSVAAMISLFDMLDSLQYETDAKLVAVANVGEEGLGNLRGARAAVDRYRDDLGSVIAIDGGLGRIVNTAVGSKRWRVTVLGPGGHSFGSFGTPSAIHGLGKAIARISDLEVPSQPKTTFNVGIIEGGTSINTIAAKASALLDMRSVNAQVLDELAVRMREVIEASVGEGLRAEIEVLGERPAGQCDRSEPLIQLAEQCVIWLGLQPKYTASSTDANIPLSLGIPSFCVGLTQVGRSHTVDEWLSIPPIGMGLAQLLRLSIEASHLVANKKRH